ncbi:hypothetical protein D9M69_502650 [compost metagenome]
MFASKARNSFSVDPHSDDAVEISAGAYEALLMGQEQGQQIHFDAYGYPFLFTPPPSASDLCAQIDAAADIARRAVAGDPLRAVEYERAATEAQAFANAGYQGDVPPMVAAWAINGRTAQQAADDILGEAEQYNDALVLIRTVRLQAKEQIRAECAAGRSALAKAIAEETIADIQAAVAGIGNNAV